MVESKVTDESERDALLALSLVEGLGPTLTGRCIETIGSARAALGASTCELAAVAGIGAKRAGKIRGHMDHLEHDGALQREKELIEELGVRVFAAEDEGYPPLLRHIPDAPPLLYVRGALREDDAVALAIVGSRRCTQYGRGQADRLAALAAQAGLCIVSGGAYGIDAAAHRAALRAGGRTIAVLGSGIARPYPEEHADLFDQIAGVSRSTMPQDGEEPSGDGGAVISEFPMTFPALAENFPRRNRIISGLALGVLVVEAAARSGALITARLCAEEHGREVLALPGRVDSPASAGCHKMIREGWATLVTGMGDILDALGETGQLLKAGVTAGPDGRAAPVSLFDHHLSASQRRIVEALDEPLGLDQLAAATELSVQALQADLTMLQIRGIIDRNGAVFNRRRR